MLLSPLLLLVLALAGVGAGAWWRRRWMRNASIAAVVVALAAMTPLVANALVAMVEGKVVEGKVVEGTVVEGTVVEGEVVEGKAVAGAARARDAHAPADACADADAVVFLSGGVQRAPATGHDLAALGPDTLARTFALLGRRIPEGVPVVVSGGGPFAVPEADVIAVLLRALDPEPPRLLLERTSRSTWDSALAVRALLPPAVERIALATSALHLPRSALVYRAAGFQVCGWPLLTQFQQVDGWGALLPQSSALRKTEAALHELVGMAWYRMRLD